MTYSIENGFDAKRLGRPASLILRDRSIEEVCFPSSVGGRRYLSNLEFRSGID